MFGIKYKKKVTYKEWKAYIVQIIKNLCEEKGWSHWSISMSGSYPYASQYTTISEHSTVYKISQKQGCVDDIW